MPEQLGPDFRRGAAGAVAAVTISVLIVAGLWALAREAPSAATDPRLQPTVPAATTPDRFGEQIYATFEPDIGPRQRAVGTPEDE